MIRALGERYDRLMRKKLGKAQSLKVMKKNFVASDDLNIIQNEENTKAHLEFLRRSIQMFGDDLQVVLSVLETSKSTLVFFYFD